MPTTAQDRVCRGPFAALLILLSLFLGSATAAAAGSDLRGPSTRLGSSRQIPAAALLPSPARSSLDDEGPGAGSGPYLLASGGGIVAEALPARRQAGFHSAARSAVPKPATASYRARAPPAS